MKKLMISMMTVLLVAACAGIDGPESPDTDAIVTYDTEVPELRSQAELELAVQRALSLEGLNNITVRVDGAQVALGGWVYSPEDKVLAHNVVRSVGGVSDVDFLAIEVG